MASCSRRSFEAVDSSQHGAVQDGDEVSFECLNCSFSWVPAVNAVVDKLAFEFVCFDTSHEAVGCFIVQSVEDGFDARIGESLAVCITTSDQMIGMAAFDWFSQCGIGVAIAEDENMAVAFDTLPWEHAWEYPL